MRLSKVIEYQKGEYVALSDDDFARANVEATQTISITDFVDAAEISPIYYDKPYYLEPLKNGHRAYALLREVLSKKQKWESAKSRHPHARAFGGTICRRPGIGFEFVALS